jgi:hypothetical protein
MSINAVPRSRVLRQNAQAVISGLPHYCRCPIITELFCISTYACMRPGVARYIWITPPVNEGAATDP